MAAAQRDPARRASALALAVFGIGAGLRPGELVALRGDDVIRHGRQVVAVHAGGPAARLVPVTADYAGRAAGAGPPRGQRLSCSAPARPTAAIRTSSRNFTRGLTADPAAPRLIAAPGPGHLHLPTTWPRAPRSPVLLAITGIRRAGSLARYARHAGGRQLRPRAPCGPGWRAERTLMDGDGLTLPRPGGGVRASRRWPSPPS